MSKAKRSFHLVLYVENCECKTKKFFSQEKLDRFVHKFQTENPDVQARDTGSWINYVITDVQGTFKDLGDF